MLLKEQKSNPKGGGIGRRRFIVATDVKSRFEDKSTFRKTVIVKRFSVRLHAKILFCHDIVTAKAEIVQYREPASKPPSRSLNLQAL